MNTITLMGTAALAAAVVGSAAHAGLVVQVRDAVGGEFANGEPGGPLLEGTGSIIVGTDVNGPFEPFFVGTYDLEANFGSGFESILSYCVETGQDILFGNNPPDNVGIAYTTDSLSISQGLNASEIDFVETLWSNAFALSQTDELLAAAFQALVWELTQDDSLNFDSGDFQLSEQDPYTQQVILAANGWAAAINSGAWTSSTDLMVLTHPNSQDFLIPVIPAPPAMALLAAVALFGRRSRPK